MKISFLALAGGIAAFQHNENVLSLLQPRWRADTLIVKQQEQQKCYCIIIKDTQFAVGMLKLLQKRLSYALPDLQSKPHACG